MPPQQNTPGGDPFGIVADYHSRIRRARLSSPGGIVPPNFVVDDAPTPLEHAQSFPEVGRDRSTMNTRCTDCTQYMVEENREEFVWSEDRLWCDTCWINNSFVCGMCDNEFYFSNGINIGSYTDRRDGRNKTDFICKECAGDDYSSCRQCGRGMHKKDKRWSDDAVGFCRDCRKTIFNYSGVLTRSYMEIEHPVQGGQSLMSRRKFGIELEVAAPSDKAPARAYLFLPKEIGLGTDSSIQGIGVELRSPPMGGLAAEEIIQETCKVLIAHKFSINRSCGYHVHVDVSDIDRMSDGQAFQATRNLWLFYMVFEDVLLSFLPPSRRVNEQYCRPLRTEYYYREIENANNMASLEKLWYRLSSTQEVNRAKGEHRHASRYRGINLHPLFSARHLEIRYHSGTLSPRKIIEWANLHTRIVDKIMQHPEARANTMTDLSSLQEKTATFFRWLELGEAREAYFRARQNKFFVAPSTSRSKAYQEADKLLEEEPEQ